MCKKNQVVAVHWDGPIMALVKNVENDEATIQRGVHIHAKTKEVTAHGDTITLPTADLASMVREVPAIY